MTDMVEFLLARIAEDERLATDAAHYVGGSFGPYSIGAQAHVVRELWRHADHWTPARVVAECEAKRRIVELHTEEEGYADGTWGSRMKACGECGAATEYPVEWPCPTLRLLASPYADHSHYLAEWRPR